MAASVRPFLQAMCSAVSPACRLNGGWEKESNFLQATRAFWSSRSLVRRTTEERRTNKTLKQLWTFPQKWKKRKEAAHPIFCIDSSARFDQKLNRQVIVGIIAGRCCIEHVAVFCQLKKAKHTAIRRNSNEIYERFKYYKFELSHLSHFIIAVCNMCSCLE